MNKGLKKFVIFLFAVLFCCIQINTAFSEGSINNSEQHNQASLRITTSSQLAAEGWETKNLQDMNEETAWSSAWSNEKDPACSEWLMVDAGEIRKIKGVSLKPRKGGYCFPADFKFESSIDAENWVEVAGQSYTGYKVKDDGWQQFNFDKPVIAQCIRMSISKRSPDDNGNHLVQLAEITMDSESPSPKEKEKAGRKAVKDTDDTKASEFPVISVVVGIFILLGSLLLASIILYLRKRTRVWLILAIITSICLFVMAFVTYYSMEYEVSAQIEPGFTIYEPKEGKGYRYGPSMMINEKGGLELWLSSEGSGTAWDYINYRHSPDGGSTWESEVMSIKPTVDAEDSLSTCDPGVFKMRDFYYIGYTSTQNTVGCNNYIYVARSKSPKGPWEKWNGSGWGGNPKPFIIYDSNSDAYGAGEPCFIELYGKVYIYYTWIGKLENGLPVSQTRLAIANAKDPNWPRKLEYKGAVLARESEEDSTDIKYVTEYKQFIGVSTKHRFNPEAKLKMYRSIDGLRFEEIKVEAKGVKPRLHNAGITGTPNGHFDVSGKNYVGYAYGVNGKDWGAWNTDLNPIKLIAEKRLNFNRIFSLLSRNKGIADNQYSLPSIQALTEINESRNAEKAVDGNTKTFWSSLMHPNANFREWIYIKTKGGEAKGLTVTPRGDMICFPVDFKIQYSQDGLEWLDVEGHQYTNYSLKNSEPIDFVFQKPVKAKVLRIVASKLSVDEFEAYGFHVAEIHEIVIN